MSTLTELPNLPLEVEENVIDQLSRDVESLRSCSLTCRGWLPRARYNLVASICVRSREDLYSICDYFPLNPRMATFVANLSISPAIPYTEKHPLLLLETIPVDLLSRLPKLRSYNICELHIGISISYHATTLIHIKKYLHIAELTLGPLRFRTFAELARLLIALPQLRRLDCTELRFGDMSYIISGTDTGITRFRDKCRCLSNVTIRELDVLAVRLITQMFLSSLEFLRCYDIWYKDHGIALDLSEFKRLRSLEVMTPEFLNSGIVEVVDIIVQILNTAPPSTLHELTMTFTSPMLRILACAWDDGIVVQKCQSLEDVIIGLRALRLVFWIPRAKRNRHGFWLKLVCSCFPRLLQRELLQVQCSSVDTYGQGHLGHDASVTAAAASPDGRYVATIAVDDTIIIWSGMPFSQTVLVEIRRSAVESSLINALAFSDTGEFLAVAQSDNVFIWLVADGALVNSIPVDGPAHSCVWRRDGLDHTILSVLGYSATIRSISLLMVRERVQLRPGDSGHAVSHPVAFSSPEKVVLDNYISVVFPQLSPSHRTVAGAHRWDQVCHVWRMVEPASPVYEGHYLTYRCTGLSARPSCTSLVGDDQLVVAFSDGTICWWDISVFPLATTEPCGVLTLHPGESDSDSAEVTSLSVSPYHSFLLAYSEQGRTVWVLRRGESLGLDGQSGLRDVGFSLHVSLQSHTKPVTAACASHCERYVATASEDTTVRLWSVRDGSLVWTFIDHDAAVTHVVFSADGRTLVSADEEGRVCVHALSMFVRNAPLCSRSAVLGCDDCGD